MSLVNLLSSLTVYTSTNRYRELDSLDVTVHGQDDIGKTFAPTWRMVNSYHEGRIDPVEFKSDYIDLIMERLEEDISAIEYLSNLHHVTLTCYCASGEFCHRIILAAVLEQFGAEYKGER